MTGLGLGAVLVAVWVLLWGSLSVANVVSGVAVVAAVLWLIPDSSFHLRRPTIRPAPAVRFVGRVLLDVVRANTALTREITSRGSSIHTGVVSVPLPLCSDGLLTLVANVLALTPGTMPVEVRRDPAAIYIHVLHLGEVDDVRRDVQHLAELAVAAFGSPEAVAALAARPGAHEADDPAAPDEHPHPLDGFGGSAAGAAAEAHDRAGADAGAEAVVRVEAEGEAGAGEADR